MSPERRRMIAARRRKRRRQRRMMLCTMFLLLVLVIGGGVFGVMKAKNTKAREELLQQAITAIDQGSYEDAIADLDEVVGKSKRIGTIEESALLYRGEAEYRNGDYEAALHTYNLLLGKDGKNKEYQTGAALCLIETGAYDQALEYHVVDGQVYNRMAVDEIKAGKYDDAINTVDMGRAALTVAAGDSAGSAGASAGAAGGETQPDSQVAGLSMAATTAKELDYNEAVAYEYKLEFVKALELFEAYISNYGDDENVQREIAFLKTRVVIQ